MSNHDHKEQPLGLPGLLTSLLLLLTLPAGLAQEGIPDSQRYMATTTTVITAVAAKESATPSAARSRVFWSDMACSIQAGC